MQTIQVLREKLEKMADSEHYLFSVNDFYSLFPQKSQEALLMLLGRACRAGILERVCRGFYIYPKAPFQKGLLLYHLAARLRVHTFCYLSLESILSEEGIISQIPLGCVTLMTSGRSGCIKCGRFGRIEFTHTKKSYLDIENKLTFDFRYKLWRASAQLALMDYKDVRRQEKLL